MKNQNKVIYPKLDVIAYKEAPPDWGKLTADLKEQLRRVPDGTVLLQTTKIDTKHGCTRTFGTIAVQHNHTITTIPFLCGGRKNGTLPGMIYGSGNYDPTSQSKGPVSKITEIKHHHENDWRCKIFNLKQNFTGRYLVYFHAVAREDGTSEGCIAYPRQHQTNAEETLSQSVGKNVIMLPATTVGGLRYVDNHKHYDERLAKAKEQANKVAVNKNNHSESKNSRHSEVSPNSEFVRNVSRDTRIR